MTSLTKDKRILLAIPAILAFALALIPTLKYQWPLGWDIFYHIHIAKLYSMQGLVFVDPLYKAPVGNKINYPPIFHLLIVFLGYIFNTDYFQVARALQPVLAASLVLSITLVCSKFYGKLAGLSAGILMFSSALVSRILLPLPENLALILFPAAIYLFYLSLKNENYKKAAIGGLVFGLIALTHQAATLCLTVSITSIVLVLVIKNILHKDFSSIKKYIGYYGIFIVIGAIMASLWWIPAIFTTISGGTGGGVTTSLATSVPMKITNYPGAFGYLLIILSIPGAYLAVQKRRLKDIFILTWAISMLILSQSYWFGINVISYRVLIYALIPLAMLGGYGLKSIYNYLSKPDHLIDKKYSRFIHFFKNKKIAYLVVVVVFLLSGLHGINTVSHPNISEFGSVTAFGEVSIAPPSSAEIELAQWFDNNSSKKYAASFSNYYSAMMVLAISNQPITPPSPQYLNGTDSAVEIMKNKTLYLVYDKRLKFSSENSTTFISNKEFLFYNNNLVDPSHLNWSYTKKVYENEEFVVYKINLVFY